MKNKIDKEHLANIKLLKKHGYSDENIKNMDILQITEIALELEPKYKSPEIEEMKRLSDEFFSKYLTNSKTKE